MPAAGTGKRYSTTHTCILVAPGRFVAKNARVGDPPHRVGARSSARRGGGESVVIYRRKELAPTYRRHVEESPERVDNIAGAMVLFRSRRSKAHLRAPEVPDHTIPLLENVKDCFVPVLALRNA